MEQAIGICQACGGRVAAYFGLPVKGNLVDKEQLRRPHCLDCGAWVQHSPVIPTLPTPPLAHPSHPHLGPPAQVGSPGGIANEGAPVAQNGYQKVYEKNPAPDLRRELYGDKWQPGEAEMWNAYKKLHEGGLRGYPELRQEREEQLERERAYAKGFSDGHQSGFESGFNSGYCRARTSPDPALDDLCKVTGGPSTQLDLLARQKHEKQLERERISGYRQGQEDGYRQGFEDGKFVQRGRDTEKSKTRDPQ